MEKITTKRFEIEVDLSRGWATFEHLSLGDECAGTVRFDPQSKLIEDYDGVYELPSPVSEALGELGIREEIDL